MFGRATIKLGIGPHSSVSNSISASNIYVTLGLKLSCSTNLLPWTIGVPRDAALD